MTTIQDIETHTGPSLTATTKNSSKRSKSPSSYRKQCDLCHVPSNVLVRCRTDETLQWHFVCTSKCWKKVSGGEIDGPDKPFYVYGGMWKNKHAGVSAAKKRKRSRGAHVREWSPSDVKYTTNDIVSHDGKVWICRKSHQSGETTNPGVGYALWKEREDDQRLNIRGTSLLG